MTVALVLCGFAGSGKSTVGALLSDETGIPLIGPDAFPDKWSGVMRRVELEPVIVECNRLHRRLRDALHQSPAPIVELVVSEETQRLRMEGRGDSKAEVRKRLADRHSEGYGMDVPRTAVLGTEQRSAVEAAAAIRPLLSSTGGCFADAFAAQRTAEVALREGESAKVGGGSE